MLIYFKIKDDWKISKFLVIVYISRKLFIENQVNKFEKLPKYFMKNQMSRNEYTLKNQNESEKLYIWNKNRTSTNKSKRFEKSRDTEYIVKYANQYFYVRRPSWLEFC